MVKEANGFDPWRPLVSVAGDGRLCTHCGHCLEADGRSQFGANTAREATAMTTCLLYMAPIVLIGLLATEAPAASAARAGSMGRNIISATVPEGTGVPLGL